MTHGNEPRRKRSSASSRRDEVDEADSWLAGLRPSGDPGGEPDPFVHSGEPFAAAPEPFDQPVRPAEARPSESPGRSRERPSARSRRAAESAARAIEESPSFDVPHDRSRGVGRRTDYGADESPSRGAGRRGARDEVDHPNGASPSPTVFPPPATDQRAPGQRTSGAGYGGSGYGGSGYGGQGYGAPPVSRAGRRRAREGDTAEGFASGPGPMDAPRRAPDAPRRSYDRGPELTPIIKPLAEVPQGLVPTEPPPLVPIFPSLTGGPAAPPIDRPVDRSVDRPPAGGRRSRENHDETSRRGRRSYDPDGPDEAAPSRRPRLPQPDEPMRTEPMRTQPPRTEAFRGEPMRDDGFAAEPPSRGRGPTFDEPAVRRGRGPAIDEPPPPPARGSRPTQGEFAYEPPPPPRAPEQPRRRGGGDRSGEFSRDRSGEYSGEYTSGGTRRALRQPPGSRPDGPGGPPVRPGAAGRPGAQRRSSPVIDPVRVGPAHRPHRWIAALSVLGVFLLVAACGLGTYFVVKDERKTPAQTRAGASATPQIRDISSRSVDAAPLTEAEVFPSNNIVAVANEPAYQILKTQNSTDCKVGAADDLGRLLVDSGCNQVVRATMKSPTGDYLVTAGLFNLTDQNAADTAFKGVKPIIDAQKGRFVGMSVGAGTGTDAISRAPTQLGWNYRGHFIAYCVIARTDGQAFGATDPYPNQITFDIVETYLEGGIIGARATVPPAPTPAASLSKKPA